MGKLSKLERFGLWTGVIGLISDTIALVTFFAGFWGTPSSTAVISPVVNSEGQATIVTISTLEIPLVARTVLFLVLVYSWAIISWILARRSFRNRRIRSFEVVIDILSRTVIGFGIIVLPIFAMWLITVWQSDIPSRGEAQRIDAEYRIQIGKPNSSWCSPGDMGGRDCTWDQTDAANWAVPTAFLFQAVLAGLLYMVFYLLMPVVYPDMATEEMIFERAERPIGTIANIDQENDPNSKVLLLRKSSKT